MPPVVIAAGIAAVGTIGGGLIASSGQKSAANTAAAAQQQATDSQLQLGEQSLALNQGIYNSNKAILTPFVDRGNAAGNSINALLSIGGQPPQPAAQPAQGVQTASPYTQQPLPNTGYGVMRPRGRAALADYYDSQMAAQGGNGYAQQPAQSAAQNPAAAAPAAQGLTPQQAFDNFTHSAGMDFQLKQGTNALNNNYAAHGMIQSGAAMKGIQDYGQQTALNNYFLPYMSLLGGQQATGAQSAAAVAGVGSNFGNTAAGINAQMGSSIQNGANAQSNAAIARGNANAQFGSTVGSALGGLASSFIPQPSYAAPPAASGGYNLGGGTANYFNSHPMGY